MTAKVFATESIFLLACEENVQSIALDGIPPMLNRSIPQVQRVIIYVDKA